MALWNLPESRKLEAHILDKLAVSVTSDEWRVAGPGGQRPGVRRQQPGITPSASAKLIRPLLEDLLQQESYLEVRQAGSLPCELALAVQLETQRAALWETNLTAALESLPGARFTPTQDGARHWQLPITHDASHLTRRLSLARAGDWTLLGLAPDQNPLLSDLAARIQRDQAPSPAPATNYWLEADLDAGRLATAVALDSRLAADLVKVSLTATGDGAWVRSDLELTFAKPLKLELNPWGLPTNLILGPVSSFTAVRGIEPWLASLQAWSSLPVSPPPKQFFSWALQGLPMQTCFAAPHPDASNQVSRLADLVLQKSGSWSATNNLVKFGKSQTFNGLEWRGIPCISPFLQSVVLETGSFISGGLFPVGGTNTPLPPEMLLELSTRTNLALYDWEITGLRIAQWLYLGQSLRLVFQKSQFPAQSAGLAWLKAVGPKLGPSGTEVTLTGSSQLSAKRKSSVGFTAVELHLLVDWLESPSFPRGLYSLTAPPAGAGQMPEGAPPAAPAPRGAPGKQ
jgi:disulfide bond formation protein DsbB